MSIVLKGITKQVNAVDFIHHTDLELKTGCFNILLGATNAGKSTLIKLMAGLEKPSSGEIWFGDENVTNLSPQKRNVSLVHQFFVNYSHLSVFENIASPLRLTDMAASEIEDRVAQITKLLRLELLVDRRPQELSGGQQQRTALARALVKPSRAVFLDEPLANLDYKLREELRDQLPDLFADRDAVVVYATSESTEALLLGGNTALIHEGSVVQFGPTAEVYKYPQNINAAQVFSDPPLNTAKVSKAGAEITLNDQVKWSVVGTVAELPSGDYTFAIRPHHINPQQKSADQVPIDGSVQIAELSGSESVAHFDVSGQNWVSLASGIHPYKVGDKHQFFMDTSKCFYFNDEGKLVA